MKWRLIKNSENTGLYNMSLDLALEDIMYQKKSLPVLRFYQWKPYCISLGKNQKIEGININKCKEDNVDVVFRPTGGRAVFHSEELTYSVIFYDDLIQGGLNKTYNNISLAFVSGLKKMRLNADFTSTNPDFRGLYKSGLSALCFSSSARFEVNINGKKLIGSAQRRKGNVVLQHGSILVGEYHKKLVDYLNVSNEKKSAMKEQLNEKTISIKEVLKEENNIINTLQEALIEGFKENFDAEFIESNLTYKESVELDRIMDNSKLNVHV